MHISTEDAQVTFEGCMANLLLRLVPAGFKHLHTKTVTNLHLRSTLRMGILAPGIDMP